jgi:predicted transcriptional regulator
MSTAAEIAKKLGLTEEQVQGVIAFEQAQQGTLTTTVHTVVTHDDGARHWSSQTCERCQP